MQRRKNEILVGIFLLLGIVAVLFICMQTADIASVRSLPTYRIYATFDNVGGLKSKSPVRIGGVMVGRVASITLNKKTYLPLVAIDIEEQYNDIPDTSSLSIHTSGLLGEQYVAINIGFKEPELETSILKEGSIIQDTKSAMVLEDMIGQFLYCSKGTEKKTDGTNSQTEDATDILPTLGKIN